MELKKQFIKSLSNINTCLDKQDIAFDDAIRCEGLQKPIKEAISHLLVGFVSGVIIICVKPVFLTVLTLIGMFIVYYFIFILKAKVDEWFEKRSLR